MRLDLVGCWANSWTTGFIDARMRSCSSDAYKLGTSPEFRMLLMSSRNDSLLIWGGNHPKRLPFRWSGRITSQLPSHKRRVGMRRKRDLSVHKEEGDLLVMNAGLHHDAFNVLAPLQLTVVLRQLDLETPVLGSEMETLKRCVREASKQARRQGRYS